MVHLLFILIVKLVRCIKSIEIFYNSYERKSVQEIKVKVH